MNSVRGQEHSGDGEGIVALAWEFLGLSDSGGMLERREGSMWETGGR